MHTTLSDFFPQNTEYFYSYPAGDASHFFNSVDPEIEELVAARLLTCAGDSVKIVVFSATEESKELQALRRTLGVSHVSAENIITLPKSISANVKGAKRNEKIKAALKKYATCGNLIMAQPFLDEDIKHHYKIDPQLSVWLNDKQNMAEYIPSYYLATRYRTYTNGRDFCDDESNVPLPCVVKVSSSSSGDGVHICEDASDYEYAKQSFKYATGTIFVEEYIDAIKNFGIQFAIPYNTDQDIQILGFNQQLIAQDGAFLGGVIDSPQNHPELGTIYSILLDTILPVVRQKGWYGIGGFDVLLRPDGTFAFIDSNFRATGMTAYIMLVKNGIIKHSMTSFAATFYGTEKQFRNAIVPLTQGEDGNQPLTIISITKKQGTYRINACMQYVDDEHRRALAHQLIKAGLVSSVLTELSIYDTPFTATHEGTGLAINQAI